MLVSSHLMSELEGCADHLVVVGRGKVIADTGVADLIARSSGGRVVLRTGPRAEATTALANAGGTVAVTGPDQLTVDGLATEEVVRVLNAGGVPFAEVSAHRASLEEAYMDLTRDSVEFRAATATAPRRPIRGAAQEGGRAMVGSDSFCAPASAPSGPSCAPCAAGWSGWRWPRS